MMPMMARGLTTMSRPTMSRITITSWMPIMTMRGETVMMSMTLRMRFSRGPACLTNPLLISLVG